MLRVFLILLIGALLLFSAFYFFSNHNNEYWLTSLQSSNALTHREDVGYDFIECTKLEMSFDEVKVAVQKLSLQSMEAYPKYDINSANCHIDWWDVDFPSEADWYALESDGKFRHLATIKNGFFYYTRELR